MNSKGLSIGLVLVMIPALFILNACGKAQADPQQGAPPAANVVPFPDAALFPVDHPEQFPLAAAAERPATSELIVTGTVTPDVSRNVPVVSLASGRVNAIHARLGDTVKKGQLLMTVRSDDVSGGYSNYRMAIADETLARAQYERSKDLYEHGAIALNDLQVAQDTEEKAKIAVEALAEHLRLLGNDPDKPAFMVDVFAPTSGVLTDQQVTAGSLVQAYNTPYPFTISDLSSTWVVCDVYENDLATVRIGDIADIRLNAYPDRLFKGRVSNIGATLDPNIRTAKVRIEVPNPGIMRLGMFVKATFHGQTREMHTIVPASAVMHVHDRDFVYVPAPDKKFRRVEVVAGDLLIEDTNLQEIKSGLKPGDQVVTNALILDHVLSQ
ncbi:Efflux transporter, RND family, MFP subunit [Candidatus Sulfopaludibacter sp. SbA3]|nr:Efflux transporter, RND family, MFP subunit [Candidatus Sulfopaludibacter sp. SbA3]